MNMAVWLASPKHLRPLLRLRTVYKMAEFVGVRSRLPRDLSSATIAEIGSAEGRQARLLRVDANFVVAADANPAGLAAGLGSYYCPGATPVASDATELGLRSGVCDVVVSFGVLEHIADPGAVLTEARRLLRAGGRLALTADSMTGAAAAGFPLDEFRSAFGVLRTYDIPAITELAIDAGFEDVHADVLVKSGTALRETKAYLRGAAELSSLAKIVLLARVLVSERLSRSTWGQFVVITGTAPE